MGCDLHGAGRRRKQLLEFPCHRLWEVRHLWSGEGSQVAIMRGEGASRVRGAGWGVGGGGCRGRPTEAVETRPQGVHLNNAGLGGKEKGGGAHAPSCPGG